MFCCVVAAITVAGCIKDDLTECQSTYFLTVRAYTPSGAELGADDVEDVSLFIFDGDTRFVQKIDTQVGQRVTIDAPAGENIHLVAWGNLSSGGQIYPQPNVGDLLADCFVELLPTSRAISFALSPDDLFRGQMTIEGNDRNGDKIFPIYREIGSMTITVRNLKTFMGFDDDYSIVVRETCSEIGFDGRTFGDKVAYLPAGSFVINSGKEEYVVPAFYMVPESTGVHIDIYHGSELIITVSHDNTGQPIKIEKGKLANVLIDLKTFVNVSVSINDWGNYEGWKEF